MTATTPHLKGENRLGPLASRYVDVDRLPWKPTPCPGIEMKVLLEDKDQHPRERQRFELTAELIADRARDVVRIETEGETRTERLLWTVVLGDLVSLELAAREAVDPTPVDVIENLKDRLGRP